MSLTSKKFGKEGEDLAVDLLKSKGYEIIERNYTFGKGEIDIIALDPETNYTVFVEVKSRQNLEFGEPEYGITKNKIRQLKKMAALYLYDKDIKELDCRFDVVTVLFRLKIKPLISHYMNAFD
jgi:putative endonuclease